MRIKTHGKSALVALLVGAHSLCADQSAWAAWPASSATGVAVCVAAGDQMRPAVTTDGDGGVLVFWYDGRSGNADVYGQRVRADGSLDPAWPVGGRAVCVAAGNQLNVVAVPDGSGGALVTWIDSRSGAGTDLYGQHVLGDGTLDPAWPATGLAIVAAAGDQTSQVLVRDGQSGVFLAWQDLRAGSTADIYAQRILSTGMVAPGWPANGLGVCLASGGQTRPTMVQSSSGGVLIAWEDARTDSSDVYALRVSASGVADPAWPVNGRAICTETRGQVTPVSTPDGAGGAILAWADARSGTSFDLYAAHVQMDGTVDSAWPSGGRLISDAANHQQSPVMVTDAAGGAFVLWRDFRATISFNDLYAHHIQSGGGLDPGWPTNGLALCTATNNQLNFVTQPDGNGGMFVAWGDRRDQSSSDIYALRMNSNGTMAVGWTTNGTAVSTAAHDQIIPQVILDGAGGIILAWQDNRSSSIDIYAARIDGNGQLGGTVVGVGDYPSTDPVLALAVSSPTRSASVECLVTLGDDAPAQIEWFDLVGRRLSVAEVAGAGSHRVVLQTSDRPSPGVHFIRVRHQDRSVARPVVLLP